MKQPINSPNFLNQDHPQSNAKQIEIATPEADETAYLMATEANRRHLLKGIEDVKQRRNLIEESLFSVWNNDEDDVYAQLL
jgi:antitoxin YefM